MFRTQIARTLMLTALIAAGSSATAEASSLIKSSWFSSMCIHKKYNDFTNGNPIHLWDCSAGVEGNKAWIYEPSTGYIRNAADTSKCIHKKYGDYNNGNPIHLWDCSAGSAANKSWDLAPYGRIRSRYNSSKCIRMKDPIAVNGNPLQLWDCSPFPMFPNMQEQFFLDDIPHVDTSLQSLCTGSNATSPVFITHSGSDGNSDIRASYSFVAGVADHDSMLGVPSGDRPRISGSIGSDYLWAGGRGEIDASVFGTSGTLVEIEASGSRNNGSSASLAYLFAAGRTWMDEPIGISYDESVTVDLLGADKSFYGFEVGASVSGTVGFSASASVEGVGIAIDVTPYANLVAEAGISAGSSDCGASVSGTVNLVSVREPTNGQLVYDGSDIAWDMKSDLVVSTLDGEFVLSINYCVSSYDHTIFSWDGYSFTFGMLDRSGCF